MHSVHIGTTLPVTLQSIQSGNSRSLNVHLLLLGILFKHIGDSVKFYSFIRSQQICHFKQFKNTMYVHKTIIDTSELHVSKFTNSNSFDLLNNCWYISRHRYLKSLRLCVFVCKSELKITSVHFSWCFLTAVTVAKFQKSQNSYKT